MTDYPRYDGTQACTDPGPEEALAFSGAIGADPAPALALCETCAFLADCREWAISQDVYGVWGGTTEADRVEIRAQAAMDEPEPITTHLDGLVIALRGSQAAAATRRAS